MVDAGRKCLNPLQGAFALIETMNELVNQRRVPAFIQHENGMGNKIGYLKKTCLFDTCKIGDVAKIPNDTPSCTELPELIYPHLCALIKSAFSEHNQSALLIPQFGTLRQEPIEPSQDLLSRVKDSIFTIKRRTLFYGRRKQLNPWLICIRNYVRDIVQHFHSLCFRNVPPKSLPCPDWRCMKFDGRQARKVLGLNGFEALREKKCHPFENGCAGQNEKLVGRVRLIAGLVQIK